MVIKDLTAISENMELLRTPSWIQKDSWITIWHWIYNCKQITLSH